MSTPDVILGGKAAIADAGQYGTKAIFPIDDDKIVTEADMKVGTYTIAAQPSAACKIGVKVTASGTADTMGTLAVVGSLSGVAVTETIIPVAGSTVYSTKEYDTITSITGAGWVIDAVEGTKDKIIVGVYDIVAPTGYYFSKIQTIGNTVVARQTNKSGSYVAELSGFSTLASGIYPVKCSSIAITSGLAIGYLMKE